MAVTPTGPEGPNQILYRRNDDYELEGARTHVGTISQLVDLSTCPIYIVREKTLVHRKRHVHITVYTAIQNETVNAQLSMQTLFRYSSSCLSSARNRNGMTTI